MKSNYLSEIYRMEDNLYKKLPIELRQSEVMINSLDSDLLYLEKHPLPDAENFVIKIDGQHYDNKKDAEMALIDASLRYKPSGDYVDVGEYNGFTISLYKNFIDQTIVKLSKDGRYNCEMSVDPVGMITRLNNAISGLPERLEKEKERVDNINKQIENIEIEIGKPFAHEAELQIKQTRLNQLDDLLAVEEEKNKETVIPPKEAQTIEHGSGGRDIVKNKTVVNISLQRFLFLL